MPFNYSCFISYRREKQRNKFISSFCEHLNTKAKDATNLAKIFIDVEEIKNGEPFPMKIHESILGSCVFLLFNTQHYLDAIDYWCAKELFIALKVEEKRQELLSEDDKNHFHSILIFLLNGSPEDLPTTLVQRNAHSIKEFEYFGRFLQTKKSKELIDKIGDRISEIFRIYEKYPHIDFTDLGKSIPVPSDKEIVEWIGTQKNVVRVIESNHLPMLVKK